MKLESNPRHPAQRAVEALKSEVKSDEFDIQQVLLGRKADIQFAFQTLVGEVESAPRFNLQALPKVADLLIVDQATHGQLLPINLKQHLLKLMEGKIPFLTPEAVTSLISGHHDSLKYAAWVQIFPDNPDWVRIDDVDVQFAIRNAVDVPVVLSLESWMLCLMQVRPDRQADIKQVASVESFASGSWLNRSKAFESIRHLWVFLEALASIYIIHPEAREQLVLSDQEKRSILKAVRQLPPGPGFESFLRNATIVLADGSELKPNGQIEIRSKPKAVGSQQRLPERDHM